MFLCYYIIAGNQQIESSCQPHQFHCIFYSKNNTATKIIPTICFSYQEMDLFRILERFHHISIHLFSVSKKQIHSTKTITGVQRTRPHKKSGASSGARQKRRSLRRDNPLPLTKRMLMSIRACIYMHTLCMYDK